MLKPLRTALAFAAILLLGLYTSREARANGRFPQAQVIIGAPGSDGKILFMRTTFGLLRSTDHGKSFRWICEKALGFTGQWDPPLAMTKDGRLFLGMEDGVVSTLDGCSFEREPGMSGDNTVKDLTVDGTGTTVYAITGTIGKAGRVWKRTATGFQQVGKDYDNTNFLTIDVAPSNDKRLYLTGESWMTIRGEVWRSDDGGKNFVEQKAEALTASGPFFLSYVDPQDQNRIILRHLHVQGSDVLISNDGGKTLRQLVHWGTAMFGFAKSEDGATIWIGSGNPKDGIWRSVDRGEHFEPMTHEGIFCLYALGGTLYSCANPYSLGGYALGISHDGGHTLEKVSGFADVEGAMLCDGAPSVCGPSWPQVRASILPPEDGGASEGGAPPSDAGAAARPSAGPSPSRSNCGCSLVGARDSSGETPWSILFAVGLFPLGLRARARTLMDKSRSDARRYESI